MRATASILGGYVESTSEHDRLEAHQESSLKFLSNLALLHAPCSLLHPTGGRASTVTETLPLPNNEVEGELGHSPSGLVGNITLMVFYFSYAYELQYLSASRSWAHIRF